jgi:monofunctional biosynthetic peptidoglycan transglycosylase
VRDVTAPPRAEPEPFDAQETENTVPPADFGPDPPSSPPPAQLQEKPPGAAEDWHAAIADAIAPAPEAEASPSLENFIRWVETPPSEPDAPEPVDRLKDAVPELRAEARSPIQAEQASPTEVQPSNPATEAETSQLPDPSPGAQSGIRASAEEAAFTAAAADLFRPAETTQDPHLITIGRRLDPSRRIERPVPPVIEPRPYDDHPVEITWQNGTWKDRARIAARYAAYAVGGYLALVLVLIVLFRFVDPPGSMLMLTKLLTGNSVDRTWVPLEQISPNLVRAVIVSEDGRFCEHSGIDTAAIKEAIERASGGVPRGASTISMQVTKNLFLWNAKSYIRKVIEIPLTLIMEMVWPKRRVIEVYLNIAEWGPGIFGAEAAARHHFRKPASRLNEREAALLAAVLPNPVARDASAPGRGTSAKARVVQSRVRAYGAVASCVVSASTAGPAQPAATIPGANKANPARKPAARPAPPRPKATDEWAPTLNFGPR